MAKIFTVQVNGFNKFGNNVFVMSQQVTDNTRFVKVIRDIKARISLFNSTHYEDMQVIKSTVKLTQTLGEIEL